MSAGYRHISGRRVFVDEEGEGPPLVAVHGLGGTSCYFEALIPELARRHRVIRYDFNGHGRTRLAGKLTIESLTDELADVVTEIAGEPSIIVAHSMGTLFAQRLAATRPHLVTKLVMLSPVTQQNETARHAMLERAGLARTAGMAAVADLAVANGTSVAAKSNNPLVSGFVRELVLGQEPEAYAQACEARADAGEVDLSALRRPTILLAGVEDNVSTPQVNTWLNERIPRSQSVAIPQCGHWPLIEAPRASLARIRRFLSETSLLAG
jgi:3-oxoadipate enol-lactonase